MVPPPDFPTLPGGTRRPRILIVNDSTAYRRVIQGMLGPGYDILAAASGEDALARASAFGPDLILSDLVMGGIDGHELCRRVRAEPSLDDVPVVLLTSKTSEESRLAGLELGADDYLYKPVRPRELVARVTSLLRLRRVTLELKKAQAELIRTEKLASLGQLVAGVAHELNNPLNFVYGNIDFLSDYVRQLLELVDRFCALPARDQAERERIAAWLREADLDYVRGDVGKLIDGLRLGAQRAAEIVRGLRAFARVSSAGQKLEPTDLAATIDVALTVLRHEMRDRIALRRELEPIPPVLCDATKISQVLVNLLMNAIQSIDQKGGEGEIRVGLRVEGGQARCEVADTGSGMSAEVREKVFDPFYTTKPVGQGTGLGLSISYGIVAEHGGRIEVESEPGKGSTFVVWLPLAAQGSAAG